MGGTNLKILSASDTRSAEKKAVALGMDWLRLMENAGAATANFIRKNFETQNKSVCIVCGKGGNGGDGFVVARKLFSEGARVSVVLSSGRPVHGDAQENYRRDAELGIRIFNYADDTDICRELISYSDIVVDAVFGIGFHGAPSGDEEEVIHFINISQAAKISVDIPSGAECDSGHINGVCVAADFTVTFTSLKPCHVTFPAAQYCGKPVCVSIGLPDGALQERPDGENGAPGLYTTDFENIKSVFLPRKRNTHKGDYGSPLLVCGSYGMAGAAALSARAALRCGAGIVRLAVPDSIYPILAPMIPESVFTPLAETESGQICPDSLKQLTEHIKKADSLLIGPGLGRGNEVKKTVCRVINEAKCPIVIDADGINAIADCIDIIEKAEKGVVLTPHPGEMARLMKMTAAEVEADRPDVALELAQSTGAVVVLKGAYTIVAEPAGKVYVNLTGCAGMAAGGSGDVLAGMIAAFLARGFPASFSARAAVYLHGAAGELAAEELSETSMLPGDIIDCLPLLFKKYRLNESRA